MTREFIRTRRKRIAPAAALGLSFLLSIAVLSFATAASPGSSVSLEESNTSRPELVLQTGHSSGVRCAVFGPKGNWLASGAADNTIRLWQVASGRELRVLT